MPLIVIQGQLVEVEPAIVEEIEQLRGLLLDCFKQSCQLPTGLFDDCYIGAFENAQDYLVGAGLIAAGQCIRT